jgi:DNA processing protein
MIDKVCSLGDFGGIKMHINAAARGDNVSDNKSKSGRYAAPSENEVRVLGLEELLCGVRTIIPEQQGRFDFTAKLWCVGDTDLIRLPSIAIVGTRNVSEEGAARARRLARELTAAGCVVFSGLAKGIDKEALESAVQSQGHVVAVIGTPINQAYPAENKHLQECIYRDHLLISQFEPGTRVFPSNFPMRNKLMAALSDATVIIEAGETSGTLHQAAECVRLDRWLFISKSVMENKELKWPRKFENYARFRTLEKTTDITEALGIRAA